jgi:hypothetical protein
MHPKHYAKGCINHRCKLYSYFITGEKTCLAKRNLKQTDHVQKTSTKRWLSCQFKVQVFKNRTENVTFQMKRHTSSAYTLHRKKRFGSFPSTAGMSLPNSPWAGIMTSSLNYSCPGSLVSDIPAGDGKLVNLFYGVCIS